MVLLLGLELSFGTQSIRDELRHLPKRTFKKHINEMLFSLLEAEDDYVESFILLQKMLTIEQIQSLTYKFISI